MQLYSICVRKCDEKRIKKAILYLENPHYIYILHIHVKTYMIYAYRIRISINMEIGLSLLCFLVQSMLFS